MAKFQIPFIFFFMLSQGSYAQAPFQQTELKPDSEVVTMEIDSLGLQLDTMGGQMMESPSGGKLEIVKDIRIDHLMAKYDEEKELMGYRIQIFSGKSRAEAANELFEFERNYPDLPAYLIYDQPNFKVRVGDFRNRLEASKYFEMIRIDYPGIFLIRGEIKFVPEKEETSSHSPR